jgi:hypothetical protein
MPIRPAIAIGERSPERAPERAPELGCLSAEGIVIEPSWADARS